MPATRTIEANDLKKGDLVVQRGTGFTCRIEDNAKGIIRSIFAVDAPFPEHGSMYVGDIAAVKVWKGVPQPAGTTVALSPAQLKAMARVRKAGF